MLPAVSQSNATSVQAQELCKEFITFVKENYPQLKCVKYFRRKIDGKHIFRAQIKKRRLYTWAASPEYGISRFMLEIHRKVFLEHYYPTEEFERIKNQLQERIIMRYAIKELP